MHYFFIPLVALAASLLTFFSGFGLGTLLTPVMALFFPIEIAIALTGIVHLSNNIFKFFLVKKKTNYPILLRFGLPSIIGAMVGAFLLSYLGEIKTPLYDYTIATHHYEVTSLKLSIALLILFFTFWEMLPTTKNIVFPEKYLSLGGIISGFFGGLSGNQGALRSAFLTKLALSKETFIATGIAIACLVDITRLPVYFLKENKWTAVSDNILLLLITCISAFCGAYFGNKLLKKATLQFVQKVVTLGLIAIALAMALGLI